MFLSVVCSRGCFFLTIVTFKIPEPPPSEEDRQAMARGKPVLREDLKRFKKEYTQPVQLRLVLI